MIKASPPAVQERSLSAHARLRTYSALVVILKRLEERMAELRASDPQLHHTSAAAHIRQARQAEEELLSRYTDPQGMFVTTMMELGGLLNGLSVGEALALLDNPEGGQPCCTSPSP